MNADILLVLGTCLVSIILFVTEIIRSDLVALLVALSLVIAGIVPYDEILLGLSNPATLTVLSMFILSEGVNRTGIIDRFGLQLFEITNQNFLKTTFLIMIFVGTVSMFINNTAAVALIIPVVMSISKKANWSPSRLLIPLSFASMFGGVCTLIGTSTNLLANSLLEEAGYIPFEMFSFTDKGLYFFFAGFVFLLLFGRILITPRRAPTTLTESFNMAKYLLDVKVLEGCSLIGERVEQEYRNEKLGLDVIAQINPTSEGFVIQAGDILRVKLDIMSLKEVLSSENLEIVSKKEISDADFDLSKFSLVEAVISPKSQIIGEKIKDINLYRRNGAKILALRHHNYISHSALENKKLEAGDTLLLSVRKDKLDILNDSQLFILIKPKKIKTFKESKTLVTLLTLLGVVLLASFSVFPIHVSALAGVAVLVSLKVITLDRAYKAIDWQIIFLLAGLLTLGKGLKYSGAASWLSQQIIFYLGNQSDFTIVASFFAITLILTAFMSNNASVVLMAPLAISLAETLNLDVHNMVLAVMFASSMSFMTPVGYQTNMMIYGVGQFKFFDFMKVGGPLCLFFTFLAAWILT